MATLGHDIVLPLLDVDESKCGETLDRDTKLDLLSGDLAITLLSGLSEVYESTDCTSIGSCCCCN